MYKRCPKAHNFRYVQKYVPKSQGASLFFGSAIDKAVEERLKGNMKYVEAFTKDWDNSVVNGKFVQIFDNDGITYSYSDFDKYIFNDEDVDLATNWIHELKLEHCGVSPAEVYTHISKVKKNPYKKASAAEQKYFNRVSWLSLKRKGILLLDAFETQFMPKVTKVLSTQKRASLKDPITGDSIMGFIDMVVELEGIEKPVIIDLKTAARPYTEEQLSNSEQLGLYYAMESRNYDTNLVGFLVLCKMIAKEETSYCKDCGYTKDGRHRTCNNTANGSRCGGDWVTKKTPKPEVQLMIQPKTDAEIQLVLDDASNIIESIKQGIVYRNLDICTNWFGGLCPFYEACHKGDFSRVEKVGSK